MTIIYIWLISDDFDVGHFMSDLMVITSIYRLFRGEIYMYTTNQVR